VFNNCFAEVVRVLEVDEVVCDCPMKEYADLVDDKGFSPQMFDRLTSKETE
jgi:hypothetical protein